MHLPTDGMAVENEKDIFLINKSQRNQKLSIWAYKMNNREVIKPVTHW
jgi:hypothetical protein